MAREMLLGLDIGTTVLKAGVFERHSGRCRGRASERLLARTTRDGGQEQDLRAVEGALKRVVNALRSHLSAAWKEISGVGVAAQGGSSIVCERASGTALTPMFLWNDSRAAPWVERLAASFPPRFWRSHLLYDMPPTGLGRLWWLKEARPELFKPDLIHVGAGEFVFHRLTGLWRQDAGNAIQIGSYHAEKQRLDGRVLACLDLPLSFVAPLRNAHETAALSREGARTLRLREGIPVAGPYIDQEAGYLSAAAAAGPGVLQCSLGTAWVGNFVLADRFKGASPSQMVLPTPVGAGRFVVQPLMGGNSTWDWALATFMGPDHAQAIQRASRVFSGRLLPPVGLAAIPWCSQSNPLVPSTQGAGVFCGVGTAVAGTDLLRAVAVGLASEFGRVFQELKSVSAIDRLVLSGGAARAVYFRKYFAALFAPLPVSWDMDSDLAGARGSVFALDADAARSTITPVPTPSVREREAIEAAFGHYCRTFEAVYGEVPHGRPYCCRERT